MSAKSAVWKVPLHPNVSKYEIPEGAEFLKLQAHEETNSIVMWIEVCPDNPLEEWTIIVRVTGESFDKNGATYLDTVTMDNGSLVLHFYKERFQPTIN